MRFWLRLLILLTAGFLAWSNTPVSAQVQWSRAPAQSTGTQINVVSQSDLAPASVVPQPVQPRPIEIVPVPEPQRSPGLSLEAAVQLALANSPILREASAAVAEARWQALQAGLPNNPRIDSGNPQTIGSGNGVYTTGLTQEVPRGGKLRLDRTAADQAARRLEAALARSHYALLTSVRQKFYTSLAAEQRVALLRQLLATARQSETTSQNLLNAGQVSETDLLLLRVERRRAEVTLQTAEAALVGARRQLAAQLGLPYMEIDSVVGDLSAALPDYEAMPVVQEVLTFNPQVRGAEVEIARSQTLLRRAEVQVIPNVIVQGGTQYVVNGGYYQGLAGVYLDVPLWNRNQGGIRAAQANISQSVAQLGIVRTELAQQVADALNRYRAARQQVVVYETGILPDARRTLTLVQQGYERGQFDILRLLQTQRSLFEANLDYINAQENRLNAAADLAGLLQVDQFP